MNSDITLQCAAEVISLTIFGDNWLRGFWFYRF